MLLRVIIKGVDTLIEVEQLKELSEIYLMSLCVWREARNQPINVKWGVAWVIKNRTAHPGWWGSDITSVILCHYQFSSFNAGDPNSNKFPILTDKSWLESLRACRDVYYNQVEDPTHKATMYYDKSLDNNPPGWSNGLAKIVIGDMRFFTQEKGINEKML